MVGGGRVAQASGAGRVLSPRHPESAQADRCRAPEGNPPTGGQDAHSGSAVATSPRRHAVWPDARRGPVGPQAFEGAALATCYRSEPVGPCRLHTSPVVSLRSCPRGGSGNASPLAPGIRAQQTGRSRLGAWTPAGAPTGIRCCRGALPGLVISESINC
jgi:hypothetical protein